MGTIMGTMKTHGIKTDQEARTSKRVYEAPSLTKFGKVAELTLKQKGTGTGDKLHASV